MRSESKGRSGRQPMTDKRLEYVRLIRMGLSNSEACRRLGIDRKTGHWWKNGGSVTRNGITRVVEPIIDHHPVPAESGRYLTESERVTIADGVREGPLSPFDRGRTGSGGVNRESGTPAQRFSGRSLSASCCPCHDAEPSTTPQAAHPRA
jgi:hypothetical protein